MKRIFLMILLILIFTLPVLAEDCLEDITKCKELGLTKAQQQRIRELRKENLKRTERAWRQIKDIQYRIDQELLKDAPSRLKLKELNGDLTDAQEIIGDSKIEYRFAVRSMLGRKKYKKMLEIKKKKTEELKRNLRNKTRRRDCPDCP